jgi:hypothetical protein
MRRLRDGVMPKLRGPADIQTLAWIWDRLAQTGVDGKRYTNANWRDFEKCFPGKDVSQSSRKRDSRTPRQ